MMRYMFPNFLKEPSQRTSHVYSSMKACSDNRSTVFVSKLLAADRGLTTHPSPVLYGLWACQYTSLNIWAMFIHVLNNEELYNECGGVGVCTINCSQKLWRRPGSFLTTAELRGLAGWPVHFHA